MPDILELVEELELRRARVLRQREEDLREHRLVYTGRMQEGRWVSSSLHDLYSSFFDIKEHPVEKDDEGDVIMPPEYNERGWPFLGGNDHRILYMSPDFMKMEAHQRLADWWRESGDTHLLMGMMFRPGKLAVMDATIPLPARNDSVSMDGCLAEFDVKEWEHILKVWDLPRDSKLLQMTLFSPTRGAVAKGTIRQVLPGGTPATYTKDSWKFIHDEYVDIHSSEMAIITTDSVYCPKASVNLQEYTYITRNGGQLSDWVMDDIQEHVNSILAGEYVSPSTAWGYLQALGLPAPDDMLDEVVAGARGSMLDTLKRWPIPKQHGWRGKVGGSVALGFQDIMLPKSARNFVSVGNDVWVNRNPNLPFQGYVKFRVSGYTNGNFMCINTEPGSVWNAWLGGDIDGDDGVILFDNPFTVDTPIREDIDLQSMKFTQRQTGTDLQACQLRYKSEMEGAIGRWDILARYSVDLDMNDDDLMLEVTKLIQLTISLKKRVGVVKVSPAIHQLENNIRDVREFTQTHYLRNYADMSPEERELNRQMVDMDKQLDTILSWVEEALDNLPNVTRPRYSFQQLRDSFKNEVISSEVTAMLDADTKEWAALRLQKFEAYKDGDETLKTLKNREIKRFLQVTLPLRVDNLDEASRIQWCKGATQRFPWTHLIYSFDTQMLVEYIQNLYSKERTMLVGEHSLNVGDTIQLEAYSREYQGMKLSRGILCLPHDIKATVSKVYAKSVVIELEKAPGAARRSRP